MEEITISMIISATSLILAILGYATTRFKEISDIKSKIASLENTLTAMLKEDDKINHKIETIENAQNENIKTVTILLTKTELFWNAMSDFAVKKLHKPHPERAEIDALLDKWKNRTITITELETLRKKLCTLVDSKIQKKQNGEVYWATFMISRIDAFLVDTETSMKHLTATLPQCSNI